MQRSPKARMVVVVGVSAGGLQALPRILGPLPKSFGASITVVQHMSKENDHGFFVSYVNARTSLQVEEARERCWLQPGHVYIAPANYHLLIEPEGLFSLSVDAKVNYSRPSIDVLFVSAADAYGPNLIGVVLTGASSDGTSGAGYIRSQGGRVLVQDPGTAEAACMPRSVIDAGTADVILPLEGIGEHLMHLTANTGEAL